MAILNEVPINPKIYTFFFTEYVCWFFPLYLSFIISKIFKGENCDK